MLFFDLRSSLNSNQENRSSIFQTPTTAAGESVYTGGFISPLNSFNLP
jgi:hypothetical protein